MTATKTDKSWHVVGWPLPPQSVGRWWKLANEPGYDILCNRARLPGRIDLGHRLESRRERGSRTPEIPVT